MAEGIHTRHRFVVTFGSQRHEAGAFPPDETPPVVSKNASWPWDCACPPGGAVGAARLPGSPAPARGT